MPKSPIPEHPSDAESARLAARIGKRLAAERRKAGLSLRGLAEGSGVSHDTIRRIESGDPTATLRTLVRLCRSLGLDAREVVGRG